MSGIERLLAIMARLRDPERGCPWDVEQRFETIAPYTIEEAFEVDHAIREGEMDALREELGDLLFQVVYHAQMADEASLFDFADVVAGICHKLVQRHPHVFGEEPPSPSRAERLRAWEGYKTRERAERQRQRGAAGPADPFDDVPRSLPALARAVKLMGRLGEDREEVVRRIVPEGVRATAKAALAALAAAPGGGGGPRGAVGSEEIGRLLLALADESRARGIDPEAALRDANHAIEQAGRSSDAAPE